MRCWKAGSSRLHAPVGEPNRRPTASPLLPNSFPSVNTHTAALLLSLGLSLQQLLHLNELSPLQVSSSWAPAAATDALLARHPRRHSSRRPATCPGPCSVPRR